MPKMASYHFQGFWMNTLKLLVGKEIWLVEPALRVIKITSCPSTNVTVPQK